MQKYVHDHIHLRSADPRAAADFYQRMFAAELIDAHLDGRMDLRLGGQRLFISPNPSDMPSSGAMGAFDHIALTVKDIEAAVRELRGNGAIISREPKQVREGVTVAFVQGPDQMEIELLQRGA